jgi:hypothetical protein
MAGEEGFISGINASSAKRIESARWMIDLKKGL